MQHNESKRKLIKFDPSATNDPEELRLWLKTMQQALAEAEDKVYKLSLENKKLRTQVALLQKMQQQRSD